MPTNSKDYQTVNTFTRFPSPAQICSYVVIALQTVLFYLMIRPNLQSQDISIALTAAFSVTLGILLLSTFICSYVDPSDAVMIQYKKHNGKKSPSNIQDLLFCDFCQSYVTQQARHCKQCDRCVQKFDHHCMWINNCVGSKNYSIFVIMIVSTCINLSIYLVSVVILSVEKRWEGFMGYMITCWVVMSVVGVLWFLLFNLNMLHFYLMCKGYTTYQFIMVRRQQQKNKQFQKQQKQTKQRQQRLKQVVELTKKKIYETHKVLQYPATNSNINVTKVSPQRKQKIYQQRQGQSNLNIKNCVPDLQATGNKNNQQNIFGNNTDRKSEGELQSMEIGSLQKFKESQKNKLQNDYVSSSQQSQSIRISKFFTKNKSLNLLISDKVADKPHKPNNMSLMVDSQNIKQSSTQHKFKKTKKSSKVLPTQAKNKIKQHSRNSRTRKQDDN